MLGTIAPPSGNAIPPSPLLGGVAWLAILILLDGVCVAQSPIVIKEYGEGARISVLKEATLGSIHQTSAWSSHVKAGCGYGHHRCDCTGTPVIEIPIGGRH